MIILATFTLVSVDDPQYGPSYNMAYNNSNKRNKLDIQMNEALAAWIDALEYYLRYNHITTTQNQ